MTTEEATVAAKAEEGTKDAIDDKEKSKHRSISGSNNDEGSGGSFCSESGKSPATALTRVRRRLRQESNGRRKFGVDSNEAVATLVRRWLKNSSEQWVHQ